MSKRYQHHSEEYQQVIAGPVEMGRTKVVSLWPAYDNSFVGRLESVRDKSMGFYVMHFDRNGVKSAWFEGRKVIMQMLNDQDIITLDTDNNQVRLFSLKNQQKVTIMHHFLPYHRVELFVFPATNTFCVCQNRQNSLILTYFTCQDLQQQKIVKEEIVIKNARSRTAKKVNDYSKIMWEALLPRDPENFRLNYFELENNPKKKIQQLIVPIDVKGVELYLELLTLKNIWQLSEEKYLVYGLGEEELGNEDMSESVLPGLTIKLENHYYNGFFIIAVDETKQTASLSKIKTWKDIELEPECTQDHTLKILGHFAKNRKAMIEIHPTLHLNLSTTPSNITSYYVNLRNKQTGDQFSNCVSFAPTQFDALYTVYTTKQYDLKALYMHMLDNINEDFDEDFLMDATELLIK